jgi:hypothetical protein
MQDAPLADATVDARPSLRRREPRETLVARAAVSLTPLGAPRFEHAGCQP